MIKALLSFLLILCYLLLYYAVTLVKPVATFGGMSLYNELMYVYHLSPIALGLCLGMVYFEEIKKLFTKGN
jgi:hypothetical protein